LSQKSQDVTDTLKKDREGRGARRWRAAFRRIQQQLLDLEQDSKALELVYPQVETQHHQTLQSTLATSSRPSCASQCFALSGTALCQAASTVGLL